MLKWPKLEDCTSTAGNFINVLRVHFLYEVLAPKITKLCFGDWDFLATNIVVKNARKMMMKLTPVVNFINILCANFTYKRLFSSFFYLHVTREKLPKRRSYKKFSHKMLMKLRPDWRLQGAKLNEWNESKLIRWREESKSKWNKERVVKRDTFFSILFVDTFWFCRPYLSTLLTSVNLIFWHVVDSVDLICRQFLLLSMLFFIKIVTYTVFGRYKCSTIWLRKSVFFFFWSYKWKHLILFSR
jgi:hypothetical protein